MISDEAAVIQHKMLPYQYILALFEDRGIYRAVLSPPNSGCRCSSFDIALPIRPSKSGKSKAWRKACALAGEVLITDRMFQLGLANPLQYIKEAK